MKRGAVDRLLGLLLLAWTGCGVETPPTPYPLPSGAGSNAALRPITFAAEIIVSPELERVCARSPPNEAQAPRTATSGGLKPPPAPAIGRFGAWLPAPAIGGTP